VPGSWIGYPHYGTAEFYEDIAHIAERGVMDLLFFGNVGGTSEDYGGSHVAAVRYGAKWPRHDMAPMILLMANAARGVGFALTSSTTYHHPIHCARLFSALDHVTRGRIAIANAAFMQTASATAAAIKVRETYCMAFSIAVVSNDKRDKVPVPRHSDPLDFETAA
jgi:alkanesulfonate monooxygenase SsuD/methylene tetrahydromethanopterin reductase-like flavin-dependent oxidoreductase (luciferase family)